MTTKPFSDRIAESTKRANSVLVAGIDPDVESIPEQFIAQAASRSLNDEDFFHSLIVSFYQESLSPITGLLAAVKPNLAFFERYGLGGLRAYRSLRDWCHEHNLAVIADAKRGDIGSTAAAYGHAFLQEKKILGRAPHAFVADALTVNPFLGFDTIEPFLAAAEATNAGLFILVRTSNPGSADLQSIEFSSAAEQSRIMNVSDRIAEWINSNAHRLQGTCGVSGLGAVVGATHPDELLRLRSLMPSTLFLIPGYGAQGGSAEDIKGGRRSAGDGVLVNSSRGLFAKIPSAYSIAECVECVRQRAITAHADLSVLQNGLHSHGEISG
jgi:orotidine-5'-phosphate decarboxylase